MRIRYVLSIEYVNRLMCNVAMMYVSYYLCKQLGIAICI